MKSREISIKELEYGLCKYDVVSSEKPGKSGLKNIENVKIVKNTDSVKAEMSVAFGVKYKLLSKKEGKKKLKVKWEFPTSITDNNGNSSHKLVYTEELIMNVDTFSLYSFNKGYKVQRGPWSLIISYKGKTVLKRTFIVY
tara:strand:- start:237 stop:656 length:420 start_codon:yes stop_codon:yes gene_type:complete